MNVGVQLVFASYGWSSISDAEVWDEELRLARLAADLGFDVLWSVEHHFNDYSFCPDNLQLMSYLASECPDVGLGTAAVILPWHDPLRVAEQVSILDHLSRGRLRLGIGRGLARREFEAFRGTMDESRERFDEASEMILRALRTGVMEGEGPFYLQPKTEIRPWPLRMPAINKHRELVRERHRHEAGPPLLADFCVCTPTMDGAEAKARQ